MSTPRRDESGAALLLAIAFMVVVGMIGGGVDHAHILGLE